jgi:outer membrane biosynthesis protein TonB
MPSEGPPFGVTFVETAVDHTGTLRDAWIIRGSGVRNFDLAALRAARLSQYRAGTAYCTHVPGTFIFVADFRF